MAKQRKKKLRTPILERFKSRIVKRVAAGHSSEQLARYADAAICQFKLDALALPLPLPARVMLCTIQRERAGARAARRFAEEASVRARPPADEKPRPKSLRGGISISKAIEVLGCTSSELNRWAGDGRLPPDGQKHFYISRSVWGRAWLPSTIEQAIPLLPTWREQDRIRRVFARRGLRQHSAGV